jgi:predicted RNase H-like nuclease (RuvC/YqgF family)
MEYSYETLLEENTELRKALTHSKEMIERVRSDFDSLKQVHDDFKFHYDKLKKDCNQYQNRCIEAEAVKKEIEHNHEVMVRRLRTQIESGQKDLEEL